MTAFALKLSSATFNTALKGLRLPNRRKLAGEYLLGVSQAESIKNRANPALPLTVQGVPTYNANSVSVRSSVTAGYGFKTGILPNDDATIIVVRKPAAINAASFVVGIASPIFLGMHEFGPNYAHNGELSNIKGANRTRPAGGTIYFEALVMSKQNPQLVTGGLGKMYYYSAGVQQVATATAGDINATDRRNLTEICIGSNSMTDSIDTNTIEVFFVAIYQRPLTAAEIDAAYAAIVAFYAALGVTVV